MSGAIGMDSNLRPAPYKGAALPTELRRRDVVWAAGFEPTTPAFQARYSTTELRPARPRDQRGGRAVVVVRGAGIEPAYRGPKPRVLPLDDPRGAACRSMTGARFMPLCTLAATLCLAACATPAKPPESVVVTKTVYVPVSTPCKLVTSKRPDFPDTDAAIKAAPNFYERVRLLAAGRLDRIAWDIEQSAALDACSK